MPSNNNAGTNNGGNHGSNAGLVGGGTSAAAAKNQLEQLNTMREALFSQDGWGCQHVNQDTNWDVPGSPEPANKDPTGGPPIWKPNINNGTDLWEANLRNGGQPPPQPVQKTPWGHTPTSNLGGTWGEDDDGNDANNVWTGAPTNQGANTGSGGSVTAGGANAGGPQGWGAQSATTGAGTGSAPANAWGDPRDMRPTTLDIRNVDPRDLRTPSGDPRSDLRNAGNIIDPREQIRDLRGDPRGISGRLNGTSAEMWGQHHALAAAAAQGGHLPLNKMVGPGGAGSTGGVINPNVVPGSGVGSGNTTSQWNTNAIGGVSAGVPKDIAMTAVVGSKLSTGWGDEPSPPPQRRNLQNYDDGTSLWGQQSRVPGGGVAGGSHWKDINDPMSRSHLLRGTIGGGQNSGGAGGNPGNVGGPMPGQGRPGGPGAGTGGLIGAAGTGGQLKPDNMWGHTAGGGGRNNGAWGDDQHVGGTANWGDIDKTNMGNLSGNSTGGVSGGWSDSSASNAWNKNQNKLNSAVVSGGGGNTTGGQVSGWPDTSDLSTEWGSIPQHGGVSKSQVMNLKNNDNILRTTKAYRVLTEMGFKKEDVEMALRATNSNIDEAMEILTRQNIDGWRRHDDTPSNVGGSGIGAGGFDHGGSGFSTGRFPSGPPTTMQFPPVQKYLNQQGPHNVAGALAAAQQQQFNNSGGPGGLGGATPGNAGGNHQSGPPSAHQLRMLVQQIQMAVQGGYLSNQILNQPLAPTTLILLNQLLSNIKHLQGAQTSIQRNPSINNNLQLTVAITKYKQTIQNLQNQINAQQAIYIKQQQQQQQQQQQLAVAQQNQQAVAAAAAAAAAAASVVSHTGGGNLGGGSVGVTSNSASVGSSSDYMRGQHDAISALQGNFSEINLKDQSGAFQGAPNQQSRLNQWKLPVLEKDVPTDSTDFSRAPGPTAKSISTNSTNINTLGLQSDGTWSSARIGDGWPDSSNDNENKDWPAAQQSPATAFTDLVPEFEPGKPWKGSQIKSIEDDPSITPGSVARSPLSINPTPKEADLFANSSKASPTDLPPLSLSSSTWSFNPSGNQQNFTSWSDNVPQQSATTSELWAAPQLNKTSRGPPPGLGANKSAVGSSNSNNNGTGSNNSNSSNPSNAGNANGSNANGWIGATLSGRGAPNNQTSWSGANSNWNSTWLLLKNLTTQIDGSTLRTLCMQHGPLLNFHLYLNQGIALCKYATREEANKAQMALNNCVLSNTTICAESPNDSEVQNILQHLPAGNSNGNGPNVGQSQTSGGGNGTSGGGGNPGGPGGSNNGSGNANSQSAWRSQNQQNQTRPPGTDAWSGSVWQPNASSNLWTSSLDGSAERGTPSNLRSLLPGDLLELN
ncbi:protein Gawky isoform X2 [Condylostylus longicornis]|uniref:protein Gawky isoform X2 n=1 Tax=Condylostylus longicornis TaxID=2530218 RepID=UPI00244DBEB9|nr:protein Gawky isoform X2 [Condylostylus longicornis]